MTGLTNYSANNVLNYHTGLIPTPTTPSVWLALFAAVGTDAGTGFTEVSGGSYVRVQVAGTLVTNGTTSTAQTTINHAATVPSWIVNGMTAYDRTTGVTLGLVASTTSTTVVLQANSLGTVGSGDTIAYSAFPGASGTAPASVTNGSIVGFAAATANWGTVIAFGLYDASTSGNLLLWDYMGNFSWLPAVVSAASPGVITTKAHGYANGDSFVFSTEYGGTAPTFSAGNYTGLLTVAGVTTDTLNVTGVNTSATGDGMIRKVTQQSIPSGVTASFAGSTLTLTLA